MRTDADRRKSFTRRATLLAGGKLLLAAPLAARLYYLQVQQSDQYTTLAEDNRINLRLLPPPRGRLLDRFGEPIATNQQNYRVVIVSEQTRSVEATLDALARLVEIDDHGRRRVLREVKRKRAFVPITVRDNLTWAEVARIEINAPDLPGVTIDVGLSRHYPFAASAAHVTGYVAPPSEAELTGDPLLELPDFRIGKNGVEKTFDERLRGKAGSLQVEVNAFGRVIRELTRREGARGQDHMLTLDMRLQEGIAQRLGDDSAAVALMDVTDGSVLALVSTPGYDPSAFNKGLSHAHWRELSTNPRAPLVNKPIAGQYPPGSTYKTIVALAALESGMSPSFTVSCPGYFDMGSHVFHCWKQGGHGSVDMHEGLVQSCDVYFYEVARRLGIDRIAEMSRRFGLGQPTGIELPGERGGLIPSREWKQAVTGISWQQGDTVNIGIGQGYITTTPLQLALATARIANGGFAITPRLTRPSAGAEPPSRIAGVSDASLAFVRRAMGNVTNSQRGTAYRSRIPEPEFAMAGKTGTVQVRQISKAERATRLRKNDEKPWVERDHALFIGFAPVERPRFAVAVVVEHGGGGPAAAAPIARDVLRDVQRRAPSYATVAGA
ncbi:MAG: penicillin-binding protein 2 [Alphaproteobacteria bacterium]|nr:penicillin-binding protein 2 [Alphaproteobacteria bacterium]